MRTTRRLLLVLLTAAVVAVGTASSSVRAEGPQSRSGTLLGGSGLEFGGGDPWEQPAAERSGCEYAADCLPWLQSGCSPALAGHDPVITTSIVDVGDLAGGRTRRSLHLTTPSLPGWGLWPGAVIQLWRQNCTQIPNAKIHTLESDSRCTWARDDQRCTFHLPTEAKWMTVSGLAATARLSWTFA